MSYLLRYSGEHIFPLLKLTEFAFEELPHIENGMDCPYCFVSSTTEKKEPFLADLIEPLKLRCPLKQEREFSNRHNFLMLFLKRKKVVEGGEGSGITLGDYTIHISLNNWKSLLVPMKYWKAWMGSLSAQERRWRLRNI